MKRIVWREMKGRNILLLGLATLLFGCEGRSATDEAGLLDAVAYVTGGQQEGAQPQGFETRGGAPSTAERFTMNRSAKIRVSATQTTPIATAVTPKSA